MNPKPILLMCLLYATTTLSIHTDTPHSHIIQQLIQEERQKIEKRSTQYPFDEQHPSRVDLIISEILKAMSYIKSTQEAYEINHTIFPSDEKHIEIYEKTRRHLAHMYVEDFLNVVEKHIIAIEAGQQLANDNDL